MLVLDTIKAASLQARKDKDPVKSALLSTLISEAQMVGKNNGNRPPTDGEVIAVVKKFISNASEMMEVVKTQLHPDEQRRMEDMGKIGTELGILKSFLPIQLTHGELVDAIDAIILTFNQSTEPTGKDIGRVMKKLKEDHDGLYDGNDARKIIQSRLS